MIANTNATRHVQFNRQQVIDIVRVHFLAALRTRYRNPRLDNLILEILPQAINTKRVLARIQIENVVAVVAVVVQKALVVAQLASGGRTRLSCV